ncbi:MAG TPA: enterotoxin [bacterium]|nr:enterotoxin [bacterium]
MPCLIFLTPALGLDYPGPDPGKAQCRLLDQKLILENEGIACEWSISGDVLQPLKIMNRQTGKTVDLRGRVAFELRMKDGRSLSSRDCIIINTPEITELKPEPEASILARHDPGYTATVRLRHPDDSLEISWRAVLRDHANALRQEITLTAGEADLVIQDIVLVDLPADGARGAGTVPGSPLLVQDFFFAHEHPNAESSVTENQSARCMLHLDAAIPAGQSAIHASVMGVVPAGQTRRGFLYYLERERAHPYRPFLHYNAWYDTCWGNRKIREEECLEAVETFGRELTEKRGVALASYVWDDGWDDPKTLWRVLRPNFPRGFAPVLAAAQKYNSTLGFWLSPFGGYGDSAQDRYNYGREQGFEFKEDKFSLAGPKYYARFLETCAEMITKNGSNFFKFDGLTRDIGETEAMLRLTRALRVLKSDLFISITTGTWPSPFWLWYGDSTWRGDGDMGFAGSGSKREQWMTYRDGTTYKNIVRQAPLYPLNSLMNQGIAQARYGLASELGNSREEIRKEIRSFFGCGTCLQELYITPGMLSPENWDDLAEAAHWSQANAETLVDTHWIGGDPLQDQVYGWAAWSRQKGIITLRNPSTKTTVFPLDIGKAFELPPEAPVRYQLISPWKEDAEQKTIPAQAGQEVLIPLAPFAVLVYEALPVK